jgi:hypothetical protein
MQERGLRGLCDAAKTTEFTTTWRRHAKIATALRTSYIYLKSTAVRLHIGAIAIGDTAQLTIAPMMMVRDLLEMRDVRDNASALVCR